MGYRATVGKVEPADIGHRSSVRGLSSISGRHGVYSAQRSERRWIWSGWSFGFNKEAFGIMRSPIKRTPAAQISQPNGTLEWSDFLRTPRKVQSTISNSALSEHNRFPN